MIKLQCDRSLGKTVRKRLRRQGNLYLYTIFFILINMYPILFLKGYFKKVGYNTHVKEGIFEVAQRGKLFLGRKRMQFHM